MFLITLFIRINADVWLGIDDFIGECCLVFVSGSFLISYPSIKLS